MTESRLVPNKGPVTRCLVWCGRKASEGCTCAQDDQDIFGDSVDCKVVYPQKLADAYAIVKAVNESNAKAEGDGRAGVEGCRSKFGFQGQFEGEPYVPERPCDTEET